MYVHVTNTTLFGVVFEVPPENEMEPPSHISSSQNEPLNQLQVDNLFVKTSLSGFHSSVNQSVLFKLCSQRFEGLF